MVVADQEDPVGENTVPESQNLGHNSHHIWRGDAMNPKLTLTNE